MDGGTYTGGHMRTIVGIAFVLGGIFVSVMASPPSKTVSRTETMTNDEIYKGMTGIKVSLPSDMKNFPVELVPLP
jgi:hypothetical protein